MNFLHFLLSLITHGIRSLELERILRHERIAIEAEYPIAFHLLLQYLLPLRNPIWSPNHYCINIRIYNRHYIYLIICRSNSKNTLFKGTPFDASNLFLVPIELGDWIDCIFSEIHVCISAY
jgi:hypothetical protein